MTIFFNLAGEQPLLMVPEIDGMFNVTNTYRRDSDIIRRVNDIEGKFLSSIEIILKLEFLPVWT